jgi:hypothetical protein
VEVTGAAAGPITGVTNVNVVSAPTSAFVWSPAGPTAGSSVSFYSEASASTGSIIGYSWNFGDGATSTAANPTHSYRSGGNYTVTLTVTQTGGATASVQHSLTVAPATGQVASVSWLRQLLAVPAGQLRITTLLKRNVTTTTVRSAKVSGKLVITWYATVKHHKVVVARGAQTVSANVTAHVSIKLTAAGRALLKKAKTLRVTVVGTYAFGTSHIRATRTLTLRR